MHEDVNRALQAMRTEWEQRARANPRYFINTDEFSGFDFPLSGCRDAFEVVGPLHAELRSDMRVLEIGCGMGRVLQFLATLFEEVHGIDVAPTMVALAARYLRRQSNASVHLGDGHTLRPLPDCYFDLALSFQVFQHIPAKAVVGTYVSETFRVLRPGGLFKFMVKTKPWEGQGDEPDTWHGVDIQRHDVDAWLEENPWRFRWSVDTRDETRTWIVLQKP